MKAADLFYRINIYKMTKTATDFGEVRYDWNTLRTSCRARVNYSSGTRTVQNDEIYYAVDREFIVRSYVEVEDTDIIEWNGEKWRILSIDHNRQYNNIFIRTTKINQ